MKKYIKETVEVNQLKDIVCDVCKKIFDVKEDDMEIQEFHCIDFMGGYGSIFGDGVEVKCDICQRCLDKLIGKFFRLDGEVEEFEGFEDEK